MKSFSRLWGFFGIFLAINVVHAQPPDKYAQAMTEFGELREKVAWIQDDVSFLNSTQSDPSDAERLIKSTRELQAEVDVRLKKAVAIIAEGEKDGSIGPETAKLMHRYFDDLGAELLEARGQMPPDPPKPPKKKLEPKNAGANPTATEGNPEIGGPLPDRSLEDALTLVDDAEARGGLTPVTGQALTEALEKIRALRDSSPTEAARIADSALALLDEAEARGGATPEAAPSIRKKLDEIFEKLRKTASLRREKAIQELEAQLAELSATSAKVEVYGYGKASELLQREFEKAGAKCDYAAAWGNGLALDFLYCVDAIPEYEQPYSSEVENLRDGSDLDLQYTGYLRNQMEPFRRHSARFFLLANELVKHNVACCFAYAEGWFGSSINDKGLHRTDALLRDGRAIKEEILALAPFLSTPLSHAAFKELHPDARESLSLPPLKRKQPAGQTLNKKGKPAKKDGGSGGMETISDVISRSMALYNFNKQLRAMEEKSKKGEPIPPGDVKSFLDNLKKLMGGRFRGPQAFMSVLSDKLETADDQFKFFTAARSLVELTQAEGSPAECAQRLRNYINAVRPFASKVPGVGPMLEAYATAIDNAIPAIDAIEQGHKDNIDAIMRDRDEANSRTPAEVHEEFESIEDELEASDAALLEFAESLIPDQPEPEVAAQPAEPTLNDASIAELQEILETPRARARGAESECLELFQRVIVAKQRLDEAAGKPNAAVARAEFDQLSAEYQEAAKYQFDMRRAYQEASDMNTRMLLERQSAEEKSRGEVSP